MHTPKRNGFQPTQQEANFSPANTRDEPLPGSLRAKGPANLTSSGGHKRRHGPVTTGSGRGRSSDTLEHKYTPQLPSPEYGKIVEGGRVRWVRIGSTPEVVGGCADSPHTDNYACGRGQRHISHVLSLTGNSRRNRNTSLFKNEFSF